MQINVFNHIWQDKDPGINIIQHFITIAGTAALGIGAATCVTAGTILPAVLLGLGTAATATDEIYHLIKRENSPIIARTISNLVGTVLAPPLLLVMYPVALAISATFDFFKGVKEYIQNKFFDRKSPTAEKDLEQRGAGQLFGLRQHGLPDLRIADILRDTEVIVQARTMAQSLLKNESDWQEMLEFVKLQLDDRFQMIFNN